MQLVPVELPVRPLVLGAGRAAAWQAAHATTRTPQDPPALTRRGVVSRVCHSSRTGAVGIAEFVAVHIVLVKLSVAIKQSVIPRQMFLFSLIFSYPSGTFSF